MKQYRTILPDTSSVRSSVRSVKMAHAVFNATNIRHGPDDKDAPEWAKWKAMDKSGVWFYYDKSPICNEGIMWVCYTLARLINNKT